MMLWKPNKGIVRASKRGEKGKGNSSLIFFEIPMGDAEGEEQDGAVEES